MSQYPHIMERVELIQFLDSVWLFLMFPLSLSLVPELSGKSGQESNQVSNERMMELFFIVYWNEMKPPTWDVGTKPVHELHYV